MSDADQRSEDQGQKMVEGHDVDCLSHVGDACDCVARIPNDPIEHEDEAADPPSPEGYGETGLSADERLLLAAFENEVRQSGRVPVQLNVGWEVAWAILGTIQLACRHPEFTGQTRNVVEGFGRYLEKQIAIGPVSAQIAARGWEPDAGLAADSLGEEALKRVDEADPGEYRPLLKDELR